MAPIEVAACFKGLVIVLKATLLGRKSGQRLQCLYGNQTEDNIYWSIGFAQLMNHNFAILGSRLYSPNLKDIAGVEYVQFIFISYNSCL